MRRLSLQPCRSNHALGSTKCHRIRTGKGSDALQSRRLRRRESGLLQMRPPCSFLLKYPRQEGHIRVHTGFLFKSKQLYACLWLWLNNLVCLFSFSFSLGLFFLSSLSKNKKQTNKTELQTVYLCIRPSNSETHPCVCECAMHVCVGMFMFMCLHMCRCGYMCVEAVTSAYSPGTIHLEFFVCLCKKTIY